MTKPLDGRGYVVVNPVSGEGDGEALRQTIQDGLDGLAYDLYETTGEESLPDVVARALDEADGDGAYTWVAAAGGDGTVSQVASALVGRDIPLAILPSGTGNVLAQALALPETLEAACELLRDNPATRYIDGIRLDDRTFFLQVGAGLEAKTMEETPSSAKNRWGMLAYVGTMLRQAAGWQPHLFTLTVDGTRHTLTASELVVANAADLGVLDIKWDDSIAFDDGTLNVAVVQARSLADLLRLAGALLLGRQRRTPHLHFFPVNETLTVETETDPPLHGDGEVLESAWPLVLEIVPAAICVFVPNTPTP